MHFSYPHMTNTHAAHTMIKDTYGLCGLKNCQKKIQLQRFHFMSNKRRIREQCTCNVTGMVASAAPPHQKDKKKQQQY